MGEWGGVWGEGFRKQIQGNYPWTAEQKAIPPPNATPLPPRYLLTIRPHIRGGGAGLGGRGVELGSGAAKPPKPLPPPVLLAVFSAHLRFCGGARQVVRVGVGALMGVFRVKFVGGRVGVGPPYLPLSPPVHPGLPRRARSVHGTWVERWGRGRGTSGHRRASFHPPSLGTTPKKIVPGEGGWRGGNHPQHQTRPSPYPPPSLALTKAPKGRCLGWEREGGRAGGNIIHHHP